MVTATAQRSLVFGGVETRARRTPLGDTLRTLRRRPIALAGAAIVLAWLILGGMAPYLPLQDPNDQDLTARLKPPSRDHLLGTDDLGRDMVSRAIYGARVSVPAGILVILITGAFGCLIGAIAGYFGGLVDSVLMRAADAILSFPSIILAMTITAVRGGPGLGNALIAVGFVLWPEYARVMRGQVLAVRANEFVTSAEALGANRWRVLFRHILPSTDAPIIVKATLDVGAAIVLTAGLSFIGLGAVPPTAEWGAMIKQGADKGLQYWWYAAVPGVSIMSVVMGLNFFGDGLRDALDPRRRGR
ncbi:MAG: peptide/nickel transport system permease protein [Thermomicrobiales bacterium]|nr:peptide/nickel transport system permease protein [Thermomicrobiales bacterium]MEA2524755.1 peptide/nickel transport system permease protein [Thermomicrobiales bacterium]MEA2529186.1 peptide/nickel transport system permease protein [Thermomicrobiales bacterium]MEA2586976.1 peptide/nickel transport system permease protein [Thermomicrobiales bacterium]